jgi:hypothetical protein
MPTKPHISLLAASAAILAPLAVGLTVPVVSQADAVRIAQAAPAPTDPSMTDPSTSAPCATDPNATDPSADDPNATDPTDPATDPGATDPGTSDPTDPGATDPTDPSAIDPSAPRAIDPSATDPNPTDPNATDPCTKTPSPTQPGTKSARASLTLKVSSRVTRHRLRKGLAVRLTTKAPLQVVVKLRGPGRTHMRRTVTLKTGTKKLMLRPRSGKGSIRGKKLVLNVKATSSDGTHINKHRTIRVHG